MDIQILDSWLRDYLVTKAKPAEIAKYLSLSGPSVERIEKHGEDSIYDIEITTNRIDEVGVYGIAREASAILPRFGLKAKLKPLRYSSKDFNFLKKVSYLNVTADSKLCPRFTAVLIKNVKIGESPKLIKERLEASGIRAINNVIDISNYIMLELGQPVHTFDYDKIAGAKMMLRESRTGEDIDTLDGKKFRLPGSDIVIEDAEGNLIDLCGIMGGEASAIDEETENVLLFVQTYDPARIRKTSMSLAQRTMAATIFEKGLDTELVEPAILSAISLFQKYTGGKVEKDILDIYPKAYLPKTVSIDLKFINQRLGIEIPKKDITNYLLSLGFECKWIKETLLAKVPSYRAKDVAIPEDLLEEIARIYGYHNLPSTIMNGEIPTRPINSQFGFEMKLKNLLSGWGGSEVYTLSLVSKVSAGEKALKLKNALGADSEYLRTSLMPSLVSAAVSNINTADKFHLFELTNVYLPQANDLPIEKLMLGGIFNGYDYRDAKGILEALSKKLHIKVAFTAEDLKGFDASKSAVIKSAVENIGRVGFVENTNYIYYEFDLEKIYKLSPSIIKFEEISKYPAQEEDITFVIPEKTEIGKICDLITSVHLVQSCSVGNPYNRNNYTFHVWYHDSGKTLTDAEVEKVRGEIISSVKQKFGATIKE